MDLHAEVLRWLYDFAAHGVVTTDAALTIVGWNFWMERHSGRGAASVLGRPLFEVYPELVQRQLDWMYQAVLQGQVVVMSHRLHRYLLPMPSPVKDSPVLMQQSVHIAPVMLEGANAGTITLIQDVTERVTYEDALNAANTILEQRVAARTVALASINERLSLEIAERRRAEAEVQAAHARLQSLSYRLVDLQEAERKHLARELHDEIGQQLTGLKLGLELLGRLPPAQLQPQLEKALISVNELMHQIRTLSLDLRPAMLDDLGLLPALLWLFERYSEQTAIQVSFKHSALESRFDSTVETTIYRITQEALTNVARHAGVGDVRVRAWANQHQVSLLVEDTGRGFDPQVALADKASSGLMGMRERVGLLQGDLSIESWPGGGTRLCATLPLRAGGEAREERL
jgi:signal transduction histidine kinase